MGRLRNRLLPLLLILSLTCFKTGWRCQAQRLAAEEVEVLKLINAKMRVGWDTSVEPCSMSQGWVDPTSDDDVARNVTCECDLTNVCHVTSISLKSQNLTGVLPAEFANLTSLKNLDLSRNYLNGSIPSAWARLPIVKLSLLGNRISGRIPEELGSMTMLQSLVLEDNQLEGPIPESIGKLKNLSRLFLSANNFSGELPGSLGNLENMSDFRIDGNPFSGKIPSFIGNWVQLNRLDIQGTNLEGPFPPSFANLSKITELKVTGLRGMNGEFPYIRNMKNMKRLVLRNMSINGQLPFFIGDMSQLKILDLSFNNLSGQIPDQYSALDNSIDYMFLTSNMLSGTIPLWIRSSNKNLDLSFNNFSGSNTPSECQIGNVNLVGRSTKNNSIEACLSEDNSCLGEKKNYNFSINCGGKMVTIGDLIYEEDSTVQGSSYFKISRSRKWAYSSTGVFLGNESLKFTAVNATTLNLTDLGLYTTARLSPLSLKYYGLCLQKGNYTISLHFAEIMFIDDETYFSVGKRIFDVSIQGEKVLEDFDIVKKANGTGKKIVMNFTAIVDGTLEIHFQWMGKGTNAIPHRGVYGPLISAISVTPNFTPKIDFTVHKGGNQLSVGAIIGIVVAVCLIIFLLLAFWCYFRRKPTDYELGGVQLQTGMFTLRQIKAATKNFSPENKIGEGGFGSVYKGELSDGSLIAVKQLSSKSKQGNREFVNEIGMIAALNHPNLVRLFGCCIEGNQLLVIYEYMENNCLARALFGPELNRLSLDWPTRKRICVDIARGLTYLHEESRLRIVHRDIKATNILLDKDLSAKISDFGLAKLNEEDNTHISTRIAGTVGYMAPEYAMRGYLTDKADVYSFGIVMLEIVSGKSNTNYKPKEEFVYLLDWAYVLHERGNLLELVDPNLGMNYSQEEAMKMLELTLVCTNPSPTLRPAMSTVMSILDGTTEVQMQPFTSFASSREDIRFRSFERWSKESQTPATSTDGPWSISSGSLSGTKAKS